MTPLEFKAWFEGFTEAMRDTPSKKQWERIKERVGQIDGSAVTHEYVHRYWPYWTTFTNYTPYPYSTHTILCNDSTAGIANAASINISGLSGIGTTMTCSSVASPMKDEQSTPPVDTLSVMYSCGKLDAQEMATS